MARAGTTTPFWWGSSITSKQSNYDPSAYPQLKRDGSTVAVDSFEPNPWGLYNVHGNVWEWTEDRWHRSNSDNPGDGRARHRFLRRRVVRGGSWYARAKALRPSHPSEYPRPQRRPGFSAVQNVSSLILTSLPQGRWRGLNRRPTTLVEPLIPPSRRGGLSRGPQLLLCPTTRMVIVRSATRGRN